VAFEFQIEIQNFWTISLDKRENKGAFHQFGNQSLVVEKRKAIS